MLERLKYLRKILNLSQAEMSTRMGLAQNFISCLETGKRKILERHIKIIYCTFNVNEEWFREGTGTMFADPKIPEEIEQMTLNQQDRDFMKRYAGLPREERDVIIRAVDIIKNKL